MKKGKKSKIKLLVVLGLILLLILLTNMINYTNVVRKGQKFLSSEEVLMALEISEREANDTSLDVCPPYKLVYSFDYDENTIIFYSYCEDIDGEKGSDYSVSILKKNRDGTLSFTNAGCDFKLSEPQGNEDYYYFTNIETRDGKKSISFLYLPEDSNKEIYVDGIKAEKRLVSIEGSKFYICYAISDPDTFFSNWSTEISERHKIEIK